jgi:hypothetical protein
MKEEWRQIPEWPRYDISSIGRVRSRKSGCILKPYKNKNGYHEYKLGSGISDSFKNIRVHVLVCSIFHGPKPSPKHEVAHRNGNGSDNRASNVRWATRIENCADTIKHGRTTRGSKQPTSILTEEKVRMIRKLSKYKAGKDLARIFSVSRQTISSILTKENWGWLS